MHYTSCKCQTNFPALHSAEIGCNRIKGILFLLQFHLLFGDVKQVGEDAGGKELFLMIEYC